MRTDLTSPKSFFILGLPRSGTTIVASFFNSLDDGFVICEPHWWLASQERTMESVGSGCCGKVAQYWPDTITMERILPNFIQPLATTYLFHLGGYKETWRGDDLGLDLVQDHTPLVDFFVIVFRPVEECVASQHRVGWPKDEWTLDRAMEGDEQLEALAQHPKAVNLTLSAFRRNPLVCVNEALDGRFTISGPVVIHPTGWVFGDPRANHATRVE